MEWWLIAILALGAGLAGGFLLGRASNSAVRRSRQLDKELGEAREELERYRGRVSEHFSTTAELVNTMTANYRAVYEHLANGAQQLCGDQDLHLQAMAQRESLPRTEPPGDSAEAADGPAQADADDGEDRAGPAPEAEGAGAPTVNVKERLDGWYDDIGREAQASDVVKEDDKEGQEGRTH